MDVPEDLRYSNEHEWVRGAEGTVTVGITDYAQDALGDIVFIELPEVGSSLDAGDMMGEIESTKSVSEIYAPVSGTVLTVNTALEDTPELMNSDPYGEGWIATMEPTNRSQIEELLDAGGYRGLTEE
jgi:glycine cleavage system H protein